MNIHTMLLLITDCCYYYIHTNIQEIRGKFSHSEHEQEQDEADEEEDEEEGEEYTEELADDLHYLFEDVHLEQQLVYIHT